MWIFSQVSLILKLSVKGIIFWMKKVKYLLTRKVVELLLQLVLVVKPKEWSVRCD